MNDLYYLDANILIYNFEGSLPFDQHIQVLKNKIALENAIIATSYISYAECIRMPLKQSNQPLIKAYKDFFASKALKKSNITKAIIEKAAEISATHNFKLLDSLHLASALQMGCNTFITNDKRLSRFSDLPIVILSEF